MTKANQCAVTVPGTGGILNRLDELINNALQLAPLDYETSKDAAFPYWNAFECLVDAVCILRPQPKLSKEEQQEKIDDFFADRALNPATISECYRSFIDRGFVGKATHTLEQCFPDRAGAYVFECFKIKPEQDRLYNIRNAINHGDIEAENLEELIRVEDKQWRLWMIVFGILGQIIPVPKPVDTDGN
jgi:hypothetical protein